MHTILLRIALPLALLVAVAHAAPATRPAEEAEAPIAALLSFAKAPAEFAAKEEIWLELRFVNRTQRPQAYCGGLGDRSSTYSSQIAVRSEEGTTWSARAQAVERWRNYDDIVIPPGQSVLIGRWNLADLSYSRGEQWHTGAGVPFAEWVHSGKYEVRWWDGVFQIKSALRSAPAGFQVDAGPLAPLSLRARIETRTYPSIFQAWSPADNLKGEDRWATVARHDLAFSSPSFLGLKWTERFTGLAGEFVEETIPAARRRRADLLRRNPNMVLLAEIRYRDAHRSYLPEDHAWWKRKEGKLVMGWEEGGYIQLDFANPGFRNQVALQARAVMDSGAFDGVMLDWWDDDDDRLALVRAVREAIGEDALILVNANDRTTPRTAPFINGYFMECYRSKTPADWKRIADTLRWAEKNLRRPRINCLETWHHASRQDLNLMRATTTLALTMSDGYCLFSDPNPLPTADHLHDWYSFWDKSLGRPAAEGAEREDGAFERRFERGIAVYNPMGNRPVTVKLDVPHKRASTGEVGATFTVPACDGELFFAVVPDLGAPTAPPGTLESFKGWELYVWQENG